MRLSSASSAGSSSTYKPHVLADGSVPAPPWWHGKCDGASDGDDPGSYALGASWDGLVACGPGSNEGGGDPGPEVQFFPGAWGEYEWQCVELSMRWMYLAWGVPPYGANGNTIVDNYAAANPDGPDLRVVQNGTKGIAPQPGDVLEMTDGDDFGHTEVVTSSSVNVHGDGTVTVMTENLDSPTNGYYTLTDDDWTVDGGFGTVVDWLHNPAWSLEEPIVSEITSSGELEAKAGKLRGASTELASGISQAEVIGGGGSEPDPILVVLTTSGAVEARDDVSGAPWWTLVSGGVTEISAASGEGTANKQPTIGWLTSGGAFYVQNGGFSTTPVEEATGVRSIAIGSDSPEKAAVIGYVNHSYQAFVRVGSGPFVRAASGVRTLSLAADSSDSSEPIEGYVGVAGRAFLRQGVTGRFTEIGPTAAHSVAQISVAGVGLDATPLVGYLTTAGDAYVEDGTSGWVHEATRAQSVEVAAGENSHGFPVFAVETSSGTWETKDGSLSSGYVQEGDATALGISALVVS